MSTVYFISDLHLGHRSILDHTAAVPGAWRGGETVAEHDAWVVEQLLSVKPNKRTFWWILGDVAMDANLIDRLIHPIPGRKILVLGNHDKFHTYAYLRTFERVVGTVKKYGFWISHVPMHESELRGKPNVHGHCHHDQLRDDPRYLNVAIEWAPSRRPLSLEQVREILRPEG